MSDKSVIYAEGIIEKPCGEDTQVYRHPANVSLYVNGPASDM